MRLCFHRSLIYKPRWLCWLRRGLQGIFLVVRIQSRPMSNIFLFIILHHLKIPLKCKFPSYNYETKVLRKDFKYLSNKRSPATILLGKYSRPYAVIKDPTFTYFWKKSWKNWVKIEKSGYFQKLLYSIALQKLQALR